MSEFTEHTLKLDFFDQTGRKARLMEEMLYELGFKGSGKWLIIPAGIELDGSTSPRLLWPFVPPWGHETSKASIVHDYLLERYKKGDPLPGYETRKDIDDEYYIALKACDVFAPIAYACWLATRFQSKRRLFWTQGVPMPSRDWHNR